MSGERMRPREAMREAKLEAVVAQARRVAAAVRDSVPAAERDRVGLRELLIAAAMKSPQMVAEVARNAGIHMRRLVLALEEWPIKDVPSGLVQGVGLSAAARSLLGASAGAAQPGCRNLVQRLLDPALLPSPPQSAEDGGTEPDATAKVLSRLGLI